MTEAAPPPVDLPIVAKVSNEFFVRRMLLVALILGMGLYFLRDGYIGWPRENAAAKAKGIEKPPRSDLDILLQKVLGYTMVPLSLAGLVYYLKIAKQTYHFDGQTLLVTDCPPVPMSSIRTIDRTKWDRKGIAYLGYELADGTTGRVKLDDFIFQRPPTDRIFDIIEKTLTPAVVETPPTVAE